MVIQITSNSTLDCLFNNLFSLTTKSHQRSALLIQSAWLISWNVPSRKATAAENISKSWRHHGVSWYWKKIENRQSNLAGLRLWKLQNMGIESLCVRHPPFQLHFCWRFGLSTFGLSTFQFVDVLVCRRFGCRRFGLSTFWPVTLGAAALRFISDNPDDMLESHEKLLLHNVAFVWL